MSLDATPQSDYQERLDQQFNAIQAAAADHANNTLCVHTWEWPLTRREGEVKSALGVMSGSPEAEYSDGYREQNGHPTEGMIGLATTALTSAANIDLYQSDNNSKTGLLLMDAKPIFVYNDDAYSYYHQPEIGEEAFELELQPRNHDKAKENFADELAELQGVNRHDEPTIINPLCPERHAKAKQAYAHLMQRVTEQGGYHDYNEVNVNARLDHVAGVLVRHNGEINPSQSWSQVLEENIDLANQLDGAFEQLDWVKEAQREAGTNQTPVIVIYQPHGTQNMVHFPATEQNRMLVQGSMKANRIGIKKETEKEIGAFR